jgi:hypothetical protein
MQGGIKIENLTIKFFYMPRRIKDRHLDVPAEANRDKHINFVALERNEKDVADEGSAQNAKRKKKYPLKDPAIKHRRG